MEIINKLTELKLIDVIFTTDGKELVTPHELGKEIREELQVCGGKLNKVSSSWLGDNNPVCLLRLYLN